MKVLFLLFFLLSLPICAQVLDNRNGEAFTDKPFFNSDFIRDNKLEELKGTFVYKKQGEMMHTTTFNYVYHFNRSGELDYTFETRTDDGSADTAWNRYSYDELGRLESYRKSDQNGYMAIKYTYDDKNRVVQEEHFANSSQLSFFVIIVEVGKNVSCHFDTFGSLNEITIIVVIVKLF